MAEYIDRAKVKELIKNFGKGAVEDGQKKLDPVDDIILLAGAVDLIPAAEAAKVRHGKWDYIGTDKKGNVFRCSQCCSRIGLERETDYCPNCGAKMDGGEYDGQ